MKTGIIGAMEMEVAALKEKMRGCRVTEKAGMTFYEGKIGQQDAVVVRSGVGKVNAAVCTQILVDLFDVDAIINTGAAGSLDARIDIGDMVISSDVMYHDVDAVLFGYAPGEVPQLGITAFPADEGLAEQAEKVFRETAPQIHTYRGRIVSGDQFIGDRETRNRIAETFQGLCTEMEGAAVAQTAWLNRIPFLIVRAISDKADGSESEEYPVFERKAAERSAAMILCLLEQHSPVDRS